ncbi:type II secretion system protein [Herbivorax sp. ANBcel31]|uniref:type IV pilus modification PilV family protein n=1 Tax=Herbivorax sp. ANBcel31 TaxID=3069754 RepID=UPI0027B0B7CF|nr:type II secretion system protein [Herbivorax sp. ANBcel31]MDQ2085291.1 type II secretion system protein [Herbivorax sp. ANBcel31]
MKIIFLKFFYKLEKQKVVRCVCFFTKKIKSKKAVTLIELIIALSILAIVAAPFLMTFLSSTRNNAFSREVIDSTVLAQKVMEEIKSRPLFLSQQAYSDNQTAEYKEYDIYEDYKIKYKIVMKEGGLLEDNQEYEFLSIEEKEFDIIFIIDSGNLILNHEENFNLYDGDPLEFFLEISEEQSIFSYEFFDIDETIYYSQNVNTEIMTRPLRIKVHYVNYSVDLFRLNVDIDNIGDNNQVKFYVLDDINNMFLVNNSGKKSFYKFNRISSQHVEYTNVLYKINLIVEKDNEMINQLESYVKKNR